MVTAEDGQEGVDGQERPPKASRELHSTPSMRQSPRKATSRNQNEQKQFTNPTARREPSDKNQRSIRGIVPARSVLQKCIAHLPSVTATRQLSKTKSNTRESVVARAHIPSTPVRSPTEPSTRTHRHAHTYPPTRRLCASRFKLPAASKQASKQIAKKKQPKFSLLPGSASSPRYSERGEKRN